MDLQQQALIVAGIRDKMKESIGTRVYIKVNLGRSRINQNYATITAAHPSVFIAKLEYKRGRTAEQSFQYADILTGVVEVLLDEDPMFGPFDIQPDAPLVDNANKPKVKKRLRPVKPFEQRIRLSSAQVAMLADRLKKEAEEKRTNANHDSIISDLSHKYDIMKKAEKTKATWKDEVDPSDIGAGERVTAGAEGMATLGASDSAVAANDVVGAIPAPGRKISKFADSEALQNLVLSGEYDAEVSVTGDSVVVEEKVKVTAKKAHAAKKATPKKAAKPAAKKAPAKKATTAKKSAAKNATATKKNAAKKATAKKATAKKATAKKASTAKKSAAKKATAKKAPAKKASATKKASAKKPAAIKPVVKKSAAKKSAAKKPAAKTAKKTSKKSTAKKK